MPIPFFKRKEYRDEQRAKNMEILRASGYSFTLANGGETVMFRVHGKPRADFYPATGKWRVVGTPTVQDVMSGGALNFLLWYDRQQHD